MKSKRERFWGNNRFRLMLTLELAVMLPAAALIYVNFHHLKSIKRDKALEGAIHRDFHEMLAISEKKINQKAYAIPEQVRGLFPSPDNDTEFEKKRKLESILAKSPWLAHVFLFDAEKGLLFRSQPEQLRDKDFREEHEHLSKMFGGWLGMEAKMMMDSIHKKTQLIYCYGFEAKRPGGYTFMTTAFFALPQLSRDRIVFGGAILEPNYLRRTFFPEILGTDRT